LCNTQLFSQKKIEKCIIQGFQKNMVFKELKTILRKLGNLHKSLLKTSMLEIGHIWQESGMILANILPNFRK